MSYVNNTLTDLIDGIEQMSKSVKAINAVSVLSGGVPLYAVVNNPKSPTFSVPGISLSREELIEDAEALGVILEDNNLTTFYHSSRKGTGPIWKMTALVRIFEFSLSVTFVYEGIAWGTAK